LQTVRVDKWLWGARFFKTRTLAKKAIEGGKVHLNDQSCKVSAQLQVGDVLRIRQGFDEKVVIVRALCQVRGSASQAALLFEETEESRASRDAATAMRKLAGPIAAPSKRPTKKERRHIIRFLSQPDE
jgi:ribosome-associated heat shock protein Hsp15